MNTCITNSDSIINLLGKSIYDGPFWHTSFNYTFIKMTTCRVKVIPFYLSSSPRSSETNIILKKWNKWCSGAAIVPILSVAGTCTERPENIFTKQQQETKDDTEGFIFHLIVIY